MPEPVETWQATVVGASDIEVAAAQLWRHGAIAVQIRANVVIGSFPSHVDDLDVLLGSNDHTVVTWERLPPVDHMAVWRASSTPVRAGRFELVPAHLQHCHTTPLDLHRIIIDAGMAFGSGHHDTTAGCLHHLGALHVRGHRVLDVGTGTGVLAIGAAMLGADHVIGVDTDATAIEVARTNAEANHVQVEFAVGSTGVAPGPFDGILANLLTGLLVELATELANLLAPGGWLIASGVGVPRTHLVESALTQAGFHEVSSHHHGDWAVITALRADHASDDPPAGAPAAAARDRQPTRWPPHSTDQQ